MNPIVHFKFMGRTLNLSKLSQVGDAVLNTPDYDDCEDGARVEQTVGFGYIIDGVQVLFERAMRKGPPRTQIDGPTDPLLSIGEECYVVKPPAAPSAWAKNWYTHVIKEDDEPIALCNLRRDVESLKEQWIRYHGGV